MALMIPEESLCTVAEADDYHAKRGNSAQWNVLDPDTKEAHLRNAFDYLYNEYAPAWPATFGFGLLEDGTIAPGARTACAVLALLATYGELDPEVTPQEIETELGPIKSKYAARENGGRRIFPAVVRLMAPYLAESEVNPYSAKLVRA